MPNIRLTQVSFGAVGVHTMRLKLEETALHVESITLNVDDDFGRRSHGDRPEINVEGDLQTARDFCTPLGWFADELR